MMPNQMNIKHVELIVKLASRCNINCQYCYYFYGADQSWKQQPKRITDQTIHHTIKLLKQGIFELGITSLQIDFHGGEPLLYGKKQLANLCDLFIRELSDIVNLNFALQTNAILLDKAWIDIICHYQISTAVSLDGPAKVNDLMRVDHQGKGTYERCLSGIRLLQEAVAKGRLPQISNLAVINPYTSGKMIYRHFIDEIKFKHMDFLLPGYDYDTYHNQPMSLYGDFLIDVFNEWVKDNDPSIKIRLFGAFMTKLYGHSTFMYPTNEFTDQKAVAITIDADGMMYGNDSLRSNAAWNHYKALSVAQHSLSDIIAQEKQWYQKNVKTPSTCKNCLWGEFCNGGHLENRYSSKTGYHNPSIYCDSLQRMYHQIIAFLIDNGISLEHLLNSQAA